MNYSDCNKMPGIIAVKWMHADELSPHIREKFIAGLSVAIGAVGNMLTLVDTGSTEGLRSEENNGLVGKATLEFKTGTPGGEPAVTTVKVTHTAKIALIPVAL